MTMKKAQAAATAEELLTGKAWVPEMMRIQLSLSQVAVETPMGEMEGQELLQLGGKSPVGTRFGHRSPT
ncbi:hypothetical protein [Bordetella petrii]|uniref:hypothetical protein n=1 Tax=Bordetella petrii TaxID=94624 RepID=UPI001E506B32|nr:hypothetical protein [Bordetella petrii]MCD0505544.1 hypothetical protein [Bordetella petrii]